MGSLPQKRVGNDILPIFIAPRRAPIEPISFEGTGFILRGGIFVTCWHCVRKALSAEHGYMVAVKQNGDDTLGALFLDKLCQDENGTDLATAALPLELSLDLELAESTVPTGTDVFTYGFPLTQEARRADGGLRFELCERFLQGYVTRAFYYEHHEFGQVPAYELDMPAPEGLSGAPLIRVGSQEVVGVVFGSNDVGTIDEFERIDPQTREREPEIRRVVSFGLAHYTDALRKARGPATGGLPLSEFLSMHLA